MNTKHRRHISFALVITLLFAVVALSGCVWSRNTKDGDTPDNGGARVGNQPADLVRTAVTLGPDDVFEIRVFQEPDLTGIYRVSSAGTINFPLIGVVEVAGKTSAQIEAEIRQRLESDFLRKAYVSVFIKEFNSKKVFVFGEVQKPGTFRYEERMTIIQAITLAGGFTKAAAKNNVAITRIVDGKEKHYTVEVENIWKGRQENVLLKPGDIIFVPETLF